MKKYLLVLILIFGLGISVKGMDPLCVKNHGSAILNDQKWHTLKFKILSNGSRHMLDILIRQVTPDGQYEFKDVSTTAMVYFYAWVTYYFSTEVSMEENSNGGYIGGFCSSSFVPYVDNVVDFVGIDIFK